MSWKMSLALATVVLCATSVGTQAETRTGGVDREALPALRATSMDDEGRRRTITVELRLLNREDYQVVRRPSASSVTLGFPATRIVTRDGRRVRVRARPCALSTFRLSVVGGTADPATVARAHEPQAQKESVETEESRVVAVSRLRTEIVDNSRTLTVDGVRAARVGSGTTVSRLVLTGRTLRQGYPCATANRYTLGPDLEDSLKIG